MAGKNTVNIKIQVTGDKKASAGIKRVSKNTKKLGKNAKKTGGGLKKLTGAFSALGIGVLGGAAALGTLIGVFGKSIKAAADFETSIGNVKTLLLDTPEVADELGDRILEMAGNFPQGPDELGAAAYPIVSAGFTDAAEAADILGTSAKLATAGLGTMEQSTNLMTIAMNAFAKEELTSSQTGDILFKTVKNGITDVRRLSESFGKAAGNASAADIKFADFSASVSALSAVTGKTSEAQNSLSQAYIELTVDGGKLDKALQENGSSLGELNELIQGSGSFVTGMELARDKMGVTNTEFKNMFSSAEAGTSVFQLLTEANDTYTTALEDMLGPAGELDEAFLIQTATFNEQVKLIKSKLAVAMIKLGAVILPKITGAAKFLRDKFEEWKPTLTDIWNKLKDFGNTLKDIVMPQLISLRDALIEAWPWLKKILIVIGIVVVALIALAAIINVVVAGIIYGLVAAIIKVGTWIVKLRQWLQKFMLEGLQRLVELWKAAWEGIKHSFVLTVAVIWHSLKLLGRTIVSIFKAIKNTVTSIWRSLWNGIKNIVRGIGGAVVGAIKGALNGLIGILNQGIGKVNELIRKVRSVPKIGGLVPDVNIPTIPKLAEGGDLKAGQTGIVGEQGVELFTPKVAGRVTPSDQLGNITNHFHIGSIDSKETADHFAERVRQVMANDLRASKQGA